MKQRKVRQMASGEEGLTMRSLGMRQLVFIRLTVALSLVVSVAAGFKRLCSNRSRIHWVEH